MPIIDTGAWGGVGVSHSPGFVRESQGAGQQGAGALYDADAFVIVSDEDTAQAHINNRKGKMARMINQMKNRGKVFVKKTVVGVKK